MRNDSKQRATSCRSERIRSREGRWGEADASIRIIVSEGCAMPVKGNLTQPETLKKFAHVFFRKFVHLVQIVVNG